MKICIFKIPDSNEEIKEEHLNMFSCLKRGIELAAEKNSMVTFYVYGGGLGRWQIIGFFHPDKTFTDSFGERKRWTGSRGNYWEPCDLEPYSPFNNLILRCKNGTQAI